MLRQRPLRYDRNRPAGLGIRDELGPVRLATRTRDEQVTRTDESRVLAHAGNFASGRRSSVDAARKAPNLYIEICSSWREFGSIEELVEGAGEDRVLYGSDLPLMDPRIQAGRVLTADIGDAAKRKVLGENAARLLHITT